MYNIYLALHFYSNVGVLISPHNILWERSIDITLILIVH